VDHGNERLMRADLLNLDMCGRSISSIRQVVWTPPPFALEMAAPAAGQSISPAY